MSEMPEGWIRSELAEMTDIVMGQSPPSEDYNTSGAGKPFLQGKAEFTHFNPIPTKYCTRPLKIGTAGSVLMSVRAPVGDVNIADQDYIIGRGLAALQSKHGDNHFLFYALMHNKERIAALGSGTTFQSINRAVLDNFSFPLPPLPEQRAIAASLRAVQDVRDARRRELDAEREHKAALMEDLFTCGVRGEPQKDTELGSMPQSWRVVRLDSVAEQSNKHAIVDGPFGASIKQTDYTKCGIPLIRIKNISKAGKFVDDDFLYISADLFEKLSRSTIRKGDILVSRVGTIGNVCIYPGTYEKALLSTTGVCKVTVEPAEADRRFVYQFMMTPGYNQQLLSNASASVQKYISLGTLRGSLLPLPPLDEQQDIADVLTACDEKIAALEAEAALHDELFRALLDDLMTGRVSARSLIKTEGGEEEA